MIGGRGRDESTTIAEYRDGSWSNIGNLLRKRGYHSAIKSGSDIMVIGGMEQGATK